MLKVRDGEQAFYVSKREAQGRRMDGADILTAPGWYIWPRSEPRPVGPFLSEQSASLTLDAY